MKQLSTLVILSSIFPAGLTSCGNGSTETESSAPDILQVDTNADSQKKEHNNIFDRPDDLTSILSQNGIGKLKKWSNPMEMGWGSLTDYYQFGDKKDGVGMQNNLAYYLEGDETSAKTLTIYLNINNPVDKKNALKFLSGVTEKTFKSLNLELPNGLTKAIVSSETFKADIPNFEVSVELDKSKIETWKVNIVKKK